MDDAQADKNVGAVDTQGVELVVDAQVWTVAPAEH